MQVAMMETALHGLPLEVSLVGTMLFPEASGAQTLYTLPQTTILGPICYTIIVFFGLCSPKELDKQHLEGFGLCVVDFQSRLEKDSIPLLRLLLVA